MVDAGAHLPLVHARGLVKRFGALVAVDGVDFDVERGEAFGFLGPNGAGKPATMRTIGCVAPPSGGTLRILGLDPITQGADIRARLGVVPLQDTLDMELTVRENIIIYGRYFGLPRGDVGRRADELIDFVQLNERANDKVEPLSGGMKRRLTIARSLVNDPEVMLLDEPTTGLDPQARHTVWDRLFRLKQRGVTLILTTHYMDEAEQLCDRLVVMDKGKIAAEGSPLELIRRYSTREVVELRFRAETELDHLACGIAADELERRALGGDLALVHDDEPVAELLGLVHVVSREDQCDAALLQPEEPIPNGVPCLRVEPGGGLVQQHHLGIVHERARDREPALHAAGKRLDLVVGPFVQLDEVDELVGAPAHVAPRQAEVTAVDDDVLAYCQLHVERVLQRHDAEPRTDVGPL